MASSSGGRDRFTILPNEMLQAIASKLDLKDALKLRVVLRKNQEDALVEIFKQNLKTTPLYVSPVESSLQRFQDICSHPFFSRFIRRVIYIPWVLDIGSRWPDLDGYQRWLKVYTARSEYDESALTPQGHQWCRRFMTESLPSYPCSNLEGEGFVEDLVLRGLQHGLSRLSLLNMASVSQHMDSSGFNGTLLHASEAYSHTLVARGYKSNREMEDINAAAFAVNDCAESMEQINALFVALSSPDNNITTFMMGTADNDQLPADIQPLNFECSSAGAALEFLKGILDLTISHDTRGGYWHLENNLWPRIAENAVNLQALTLISPAASEYNHRSKNNEMDGRVVEDFMANQHFPQLRTLVVRGPSGMPGLLRTTTLEHFLSRHGPRLRRVEIVNMVSTFWEWRDYDGDDPDEWVLQGDENDAFFRQPLVELLRSAANQLKVLQRFQLCICYRDGCNPECRDDSSRLEACTSLCRRYALAHNVMCKRETFEELAAALNVQLKEDQWDFGEYVMAQSSSAKLHASQ